MTRLIRTDLSTPDKVELAAAATALQGNYGAATHLGHFFGVSRPTVYEAGATAAGILERYFSDDLTDGVRVRVDGAQLKRTIIALRAMSPNAIRPIEDMLPIIYPELRRYPSYGVIQGILVEAEKKAAVLNQKVDMSNIHACALDEMFSQGDPVLAGVDLDSGFLFLLSLEENRGGDEWEKGLNQCQNQGLNLDVVVKDAALGIADGVRRVFPQAEQRDDCFHAHYEMSKLRLQLERRAYGAIKREFEAKGKQESFRQRRKTPLRTLRKRYREACLQCLEAVKRYDTFEHAMREAQEAMEFVDLQTGQIRTADEMQTAIENVAQKMQFIDDKKCVKVGTYIFNRAPGLALYMNKLSSQFAELGSQYGENSVELAAVTWRLADDIQLGRRPWSRTRDQRQLIEVYHQFQQMAGQKADIIFKGIDDILYKRHRASSAIEGFNAALRPHLYVHKSASQNFLELFRAYFNLRKRRWGRHKGTSAYECVTGKPVGDWLSILGFPPSKTLH